MKSISKHMGAAEYTRHNENISDLLEAIYTITGSDSYALEALLGELQQESRLMERTIIQAGFESEDEAMLFAIQEREQKEQILR